MKKYLPYLLSIAAALFLIGCEGKKEDMKEKSNYGELKSSEKTKDFAISMQVNKEAYSSRNTEIELTICYHKGKGLTFGVPYEMGKKEKGIWRKIPFQSSTAFIEIAIMLKANECYKQKVDLNTLDYRFTEGTYRIIKAFTVENGEAFHLAAEFTL
ncbi:immunoglobulin-like domain-containing protein [Niallia sp. 03133]|uniref:immunoglobulin-like domain-containing protein n=1 Tax=Niallia sp. 03133 TaxID=3458060 RepID=UPI00404502E3